MLEINESVDCLITRNQYVERSYYNNGTINFVTRCDYMPEKILHLSPVV